MEHYYTVYGYHGCDASICDKLISHTEKFYPSKNGYDWLGDGVYFWENDPIRALKWAKQNKKINTPAVIEAEISLQHCLDFSRQCDLELLETAYLLFETAKKKLDMLPENRCGFPEDIDLIKRYKDCQVINFVCSFYSKVHSTSGDFKTNHSFEVVRSPFSEGDVVFPGTKITKKQHIQLCVRDVNCIKSMNKFKL